MENLEKSIYNYKTKGSEKGSFKKSSFHICLRISIVKNNRDYK
jgi:hypothetical protein